ncbi:hypothetical protein ACP70R_001436 [Stipagrostis hirtigluma subsp. patula]
MSSPRAGGTQRKRRHVSDPDELRWASLPEDLLGAVASRLLAGGDNLLDYVRFRAVCASWRSGTASPRGRGVADQRFHPRRWMMLPEGHGLYPGRPELGGHVRFLNLDTGTLVRPRIPLLGGHCAIDSVDGLLLLLPWDPILQDDAPVRLLHPFIGDVLELAPLATLLPQLDSRQLSSLGPYKITRLTMVVCASASFNAAGAMTIMLALHQLSRVAFATSLDRQWTLSSWRCPPMSCSPVSFQGKLYTMHSDRSSWGKEMHQVFQIDPPVLLQDAESPAAALQQPKLIATIPADKAVHPLGLVECASELLLLGQNHLGESQILVCKLADLVLQRFTPVKSIGGNTLFMKGRKISVSSKVLPTVKGDTVVHWCSAEPPYLAQYDLSSGNFSPAIDNCSLYGDVPGPSNLVHHMFSCCVRYQWARGLLFRGNTPMHQLIGSCSMKEQL